MNLFEETDLTRKIDALEVAPASKTVWTLPPFDEEDFAVIRELAKSKRLLDESQKLDMVLVGPFVF